MCVCILLCVFVFECVFCNCLLYAILFFFILTISCHLKLPKTLKNTEKSSRASNAMSVLPPVPQPQLHHSCSQLQMCIYIKILFTACN